jgi:hypothetical protein
MAALAQCDGPFLFLKGLDFSKTEFTKRRRGDKELGPALLSESGHSAFAIYAGMLQRSKQASVSL